MTQSKQVMNIEKTAKSMGVELCNDYIMQEMVLMGALKTLIAKNKAKVQTERDLAEWNELLFNEDEDEMREFAECHGFILAKDIPDALYEAVQHTIDMDVLKDVFNRAIPWHFPVKNTRMVLQKVKNVIDSSLILVKQGE